MFSSCEGILLLPFISQRYYSTLSGGGEADRTAGGVTLSKAKLRDMAQGGFRAGAESALDLPRGTSNGKVQRVVGESCVFVLPGLLMVAGATVLPGVS